MKLVLSNDVMLLEKALGRNANEGKRGKARDAELFPFFDTSERTQLQSYQDVVFIDPSLRDTLYMMHKDSTRDNSRLARYTKRQYRKL